MLALTLLLGCDAMLESLFIDFYPDEDTASDNQVYGECDPEILYPVGILDAVDLPADAHEETYGSSPSPFHVHYSWPDTDPSRSAAFVWRTDVDTLASQIQIAPASAWPDEAETYNGGSFLFGTGTVGEGNYRAHEVRLCGILEPNTSYTYRVGGEGGWSPEYTFSTPGAPGTFDTFRIAISGDSRGAYETWEALVQAMDSHEPDFFMFSGDMVEFGTTQTEWDAWFDASGDVFAEKAFMPAHGNHEFLAQHYFALFSLPGNEEWYAIEYGDLLMMSLNDTVADDEDIETLQVQFMENALRESTSSWQMAQHHQPAFSTCTRHGSKELLREVWVPVWDQYEVDFVFAGHNHIYERSLPIRDGKEAAALNQGTLYIVSGGAGAPLYVESEAEWFGNVANAVEHYIIADFGPEGADFVVRDLEGNVLDSWTVERP